MSTTSNPELLMEAAGVKIFRTPLSENHFSTKSSIVGKIRVILKNFKETKVVGKSCGFHLTKSKWDPYPWISYVETGSLADTVGLRAGDCLISVDGNDIVGSKVKEIASIIHNHQGCDLELTVWRCNNEENEEKDAGVAVKGPLPDVASKLANALSGVVRTLECPVCLESSTPPVSQCVHGHIICMECRPRTPRCPVCRVRLGRGRCLLADKLHKIFRDVFNIKENTLDNVECRSSSLRERLFGKSKEKIVPPATVKTTGRLLKARQLLLTKLFLGGLEKAASADNLVTVSNEKLNVKNESKSSMNFDDRLNLHDRAKSASTGELSKESVKSIANNHLGVDTPSETISSTASLVSSASPTPIWGGSVDSVTFTQIVCPLSLVDDCKDIITPEIVLEHLSAAHDVPQIHFYSNSATIPLPLPFGSKAAYILHFNGDLFFFQCQQEIVWITCTAGGSNTWEWTLLGHRDNGTEIKIRRIVASLENPMVLSSQHTAPLPNTLLLQTLDIELLERRAQEQLGM